MDGRISAEDLAGAWSLSFSDIEFVSTKPLVARVGIAVQLKFFAAHGFFAEAADGVPDDAIGYVVRALNKPPRVAKPLIPFGGCLPPVFAGVGFALVQCGESA